MAFRFQVAASNPHAVARPNYVRHESLLEADALKQFDPKKVTDDPDHIERHMPDEITRDTSKRMHYAAHRLHHAKTAAEAAKWQKHYFELRDLIVLGNRKLIYRAVRRKLMMANRADDLIGDCHIVLIQAVAAFNPWMGIRFSTYAYTCLVRALARIGQRLSNDWLARSTPLDSLPDGEPGGKFEVELSSSGHIRIDEYLRDEHPLLSQREKMILKLRFCLNQDANGPTLEKVGKELGLSKERVRQVQATALGKLRRAFLEQGTKATAV
jgi:RNA polymerase sigma factor (sigma-70 family)